MPEGILGGFGWYFSKVREPMGPQRHHRAGGGVVEQPRRGAPWERMGPEWWTYEVHADKHDLQWVGPESLILATDGGAYRADDHGETWTDMESMPISQFTTSPTSRKRPVGSRLGPRTTAPPPATPPWLSLDPRPRGRRIHGPVPPGLRGREGGHGAVWKLRLQPHRVERRPQWNSWTKGIDEEDRKGWDSPVMFHPADPFTVWCATRPRVPHGRPVWGGARQRRLDPRPEMGLSFRVTTLAGRLWNENHVLRGRPTGKCG